MKKYTIIFFVTLIILANTVHAKVEKYGEIKNIDIFTKQAVGMLVERAQSYIVEVKQSGRFGTFYYAKLDVALAEAQKAYKENFWHLAHMYAMKILNEQEVNRISIMELTDEAQRTLKIARDMYDLLPDGKLKEEVRGKLMEALKHLHDHYSRDAYLEAKTAIDEMNFHSAKLSPYPISPRP